MRLERGWAETHGGGVTDAVLLQALLDFILLGGYFPPLVLTPELAGVGSVMSQSRKHSHIEGKSCTVGDKADHVKCHSGAPSGGLWRGEGF